MSDTHRVEIEVDDHCYSALRSEAERLGVDVEDVAQRAVSAWINDMNEGSVSPASSLPS